MRTEVKVIMKHYVNISMIALFQLLLAMCSPLKTTESDEGNQLVRLAVIEVDSSQLESYNTFLREEIEASLRLEPGVHTLYAAADKARPHYVTIFETYADSTHYRSHLATPHFQKYKQGTLEMVKQLALIPMWSILYHRKAAPSNVREEELYVRVDKVELNDDAVEEFDKFCKDVMLPRIENDSGVLVMYVVAEKEHPTRVWILQVYESVDTYNPEYLTLPASGGETEHDLRSERELLYYDIH